MSEITEYISKSKRKLAAGKTLYDNGFYEESVDHFYYSMYLITKALLLKKNIPSKTHQGTINMLFLHYVKTGELDREVYSIFASSQSTREQVDYGSVDDVSPEKSLKIMMANEELLSFAENKIT